MNLLLPVAAAYQNDSLAFAVIVSKLMRLVDPRTDGSVIRGATNVLSGGKKKASRPGNQHVLMRLLQLKDNKIGQ